ncbi:hypothetical protein Bca52824_073163 [Brassica carinata]|uniref:Uncharacterized protein n=1 Tax=Brassica carinata TaxID=52824 RepID=A0A8X7U5K4_BRACI|nr:hypothetical protein Bca52824_073163 [Brassica carinata]
METISGGRNVGSSSGGTGSKEIRTNTGEEVRARKGNVCGDDLAVDNRENKEGKVEEGGAVKTASDNLPQQICLIEDTRTLSVEQVLVENGNNGGAHEDAAAEDEGDDSDYDYNGWHDYCRNDCDDDDARFCRRSRQRKKWWTVWWEGYSASWRYWWHRGCKIGVW